MAKDTLAIYNVSKKSLTKIANVKSYKVPQKWAGYVAYLLHDIKAPKKEATKTDKTKKKAKAKKLKKVNAKNGYHLVLRNLATQKEDTIRYVKSYSFAKEGKSLTYITTGKTGSKLGSVFVLNLNNNQKTEVFSSQLKTKYYQLTLNDAGNKLGFVVDADTTKALVRPHQLYVWKGSGKATEIKDQNSTSKGYKISSNGRISFAKDNSKMYFGLATQPIVKDTTLLKDEIVNVEVWAYDSPRLYTVQEIQVGRDKSKSYSAALHLNSNKVVQLATTKYPNASFGNEGNSENVLISNPTPYILESQWSAVRASDYSIINSSTGAVKNILTKLAGGARLSPQGKFAYGYNTVDSTWFAYDIAKNTRIDFTKGKVFYNELNDTPNHPRSYGLAGWTKDDKEILIYDRYDIFKFNPTTGQSTKLTNGRASKTVYRYARLDREERFINESGNWLLTTFNETTKNSGYFEFNAKRNRGKQLLEGPFRYSNPMKAVDSKNILFTRQSFIEFPNLRLSDLSFKKQTVLSDANPQQKDYNWGTIELHEFTSLDGKALKLSLIHI